jgi:predicted metal-binding membrane protein
MTLSPTQQQEVRRDFATLVATALLGVLAVIAWLVMLGQTGTGMGMGMQMDGVLAGAPTYLAAWGVMMAAMMLPSATPMLAFYAGVRRNAMAAGKPGPHAAVFASVYVLLWAAVGIPVYLASRAVEAAVVASSTVADLQPYGFAVVLLAAGAYQLSPLKQACLRVCQHPFIFLISRWRSGYFGTLRMAWLHAVYCIGCCWALMAVLVAAGAMALPWLLLVAAVMTAEKVLPGGEWVARVAGVALLIGGLVVALRPDIVIVPVLHII